MVDVRFLADPIQLTAYVVRARRQFRMPRAATAPTISTAEYVAVTVWPVVTFPATTGSHLCHADARTKHFRALCGMSGKRPSVAERPAQRLSFRMRRCLSDDLGWPSSNCCSSQTRGVSFPLPLTWSHAVPRVAGPR